jgi:hypothetical protein
MEMNVSQIRETGDFYGRQLFPTLFFLFIEITLSINNNE